MQTRPLILLFPSLRPSAPTRKLLPSPPPLSTGYDNFSVLSPPLLLRPRTKMLAFFTPAFWIMMIQINAVTLRVVPGSRAAESRPQPPLTRSPQTTQTSKTSGGAARRRHSTRVTRTRGPMTSPAGDSTVQHISHTTARNDVVSDNRIRKISDEEVCPLCQCLLSRSERNKNKVGKARRGRCDDCFRSMPAPVADMGGPSYSSRVRDATTESTFPPETTDVPTLRNLRPGCETK